jgi:hypothetical protein
MNQPEEGVIGSGHAYPAFIPHVTIVSPRRIVADPCEDEMVFLWIEVERLSSNERPSVLVSLFKNLL